MAIEKFRLAALVDRLIYGSDATFARADAVALYDMIPPEFRRRRFGDWLQLSAKAQVSGGSTSGVAAGIGNVRIPSGDKAFEFDSAGRRVMRVGQWKIYPGNDQVEIEQVMATEFDEGKSALVLYRHGEPKRMEILVQKELRFGIFGLRYGTYAPWKTVSA
jgi:hypothetical protein